MANYFTFGNVNSADFGVGISGSGTFMKPKRRVQKFTVPGRSGDLVIDEGAYDNVEVTYPAFIARGFEHKYHDFIDAMLAVEGYARLEDTYDDRHFRNAMFIEAPEPDVGTLNRSGKFELVFDCKPQRWLKSGEDAKTLAFPSASSTVTINNPTRHIAKPLIYIPEKGKTLTIVSGGVEYILRLSSSSASDAVYVDCESEECYLNGTSLNADVTVDWDVGFPRLFPGDTRFTCSASSILNFKCYPKWWDL